MNREFLYELLETASVSGFEEEIQRKVIKYAKGFADEIYTDEIADVVSIVNPDAGGYLQQLYPYPFAICIIRQKCAVWRMCRDVLTCLQNFYVESGLIFV